MNMALRPFYLLLLQLVMISAFLNNFFDQCNKENRICVYVNNEFKKGVEVPMLNWSPSATDATDGVILDTTDGKRWIVTYRAYLDGNILYRGCNAKFYFSLPDGSQKEINQQCYQKENEPLKENGVTFSLVHFNQFEMIITYQITVDGQGSEAYVADYLQLYYKKPHVWFGMYKKTYTMEFYYHLQQSSYPQVAFKCGPLIDESPDPSASKVAPDGTSYELMNKYTCPGGFVLFIGGTNIGLQDGYCSQAGWRKTDKTLIFEQEHKKRRPYCWKETIFTECSTNRCFFFNKEERPTAVTTDLSTAATKLGVYVEYDTDDKWHVQIAMRKNLDTSDLQSFTIGNEKFVVPRDSHEYLSRVDGNKVSATLVRHDSGVVTGTILYNFKLEAKAGEAEKDLMTAFGFHTDAPNKMELSILTANIELGEVAKYRKYASTTSFVFKGSGAALRGTPEAGNVFTCSGNTYIYLDDSPMGVNKIRFTAKGWLFMDGSLASSFKKDASGKDIIEVVNCFSVCLEQSITLEGRKPTKDPAKLEYTCGNDYVKVNGKLYSKVVCEEYWKGDNEKIELTADFKLNAECKGASTFVKQVCSPAEVNAGCGKVTSDSNGALTCDTGFALTIEGSADPNTIYSSLKVDANENWVDGGKVLFKTEDAHKAVCYSKCKPDLVDTTVASSATDEIPAIYKYDPKTKTGALTCTGTDVLTANVESKKKSYNTLTCGSDGWNLAGKRIQDFPAVNSMAKLEVKAQCLRECDEIKISKDCTTPTNYDALFGCQSPMYSLQTLSCPDTHVLIVNDEIADEKLVCSNKGWTKALAGSFFIDFSNSDLPPQITAHCFDKCGSKFVSVSGGATLSLTPSKISCSETNMISYTVESESAVDTLNDMTCKQDGWTDGARLIDFDTGKATKIAAGCKPSCSERLIKEDCSEHYHCTKAEFKEAELSWSCGPGHVLWAAEKKKSSQTPLKCEKNVLRSTKLSIDRTSPTSLATVSCYSICDDQFFNWPSTSKVKDTTADGGFTRYCDNELHYLEITYGNAPSTNTPSNPSDPSTASAVTGYFQEFKCTTNKPAEFMKNHVGENADVKCNNKCANRYKTDSCKSNPPLPGVTLDLPECPTFDGTNNKLTCTANTVMRIKNGNAKYVFGNEIECKKDGFYENTEKVLSFADDPNEDAKLQFDISCISTCDSQLAKHSVNPGRTGNVLRCEFDDADGAKKTATDQILLVTYGAETIRVFGEATCVQDSGWTVKEKPPGTADIPIVKFAERKAMLSAKCVKVCDGAMVVDVKDADGNRCTGDLCDSVTRISDAGSIRTIKCKDNYRLVLNGANSDGTAVAATNEMKCSNDGWTESTKNIVDFKDPALDINKPVEAICKNKCHPDFIEFSHKSCPQETDCSEPKYDTATKEMSCADDTEVLVLEYAGKISEAIHGATCGNDGWSSKPPDNSQTKQKLFDLSDNQAIGYNYHIKARCEQLCTFNLDKEALKAEPRVLVYDSVDRTLTCNGTDWMLAFDGVGVYSDMKCSKKGWETDKPAAKVTFNPIIAVDTDPATILQKSERAKKFTCVENDCMRPLPCQETDDEKDKCMNPDFEKKKYEMSCVAPSKIAKKGSTEGSVGYDLLRCIGGAWKDATDGTVIQPLSPEEIAKPPAFEMVCTAHACTGCDEKDLTQISSSTDANIRSITWNKGSYTTCDFYKCGTGLHYAIQDASEKFKYYYNKGDQVIKCTKADTQSPSRFSSPDDKETVEGKVGCVQQIPCNVFRPLKTDCDGIKADFKCDSKAFDEKLKNGSMLGAAPFKCDTLGLMYLQTGKNAWNIVNELQCMNNGSWQANIRPQNNKVVLPENSDTPPRVICSLLDPNPKVKTPENDPKTATCTFCPFPPSLECGSECRNAHDHATATNDGEGKCIMKIVNGRFKFNGKEEIEKGADLVCQNFNGEYAWLTPDGKKVETLAVIMNELDNISKGTIAGIIIGVILILGLIVFGMVYVAIRKRRAKEQTERLKSKGLEQKIDSIIEGATIIEDSKTLVL